MDVRETIVIWYRKNNDGNDTGKDNLGSNTFICHKIYIRYQELNQRFNNRILRIIF